MGCNFFSPLPLSLPPTLPNLIQIFLILPSLSPLLTVQRSLDQATGCVVVVAGRGADADWRGHAAVEAPLARREYLLKLGIGTPQHVASVAIDMRTACGVQEL